MCQTFWATRYTYADDRVPLCRPVCCGNDVNENDKTIMAFFAGSVVLSDVDRRLLLDGASSFWRDMDIKSVVRSRRDVTIQKFDTRGPASIRRATAGPADTELSCRSNLRPHGPTAAARCRVHRTWNQRLRMPVFQHLSTS